VKKFKTAVLILAHHNYEYIKQLAEKYSDVYFFVHYDYKSNIDFHISDQVGIPNLKFIEDRVSVYWGGYSQVDATLKLITRALQNTTARYFHLISAECFPLISFSEIENEWDKSPNVNYIESRIRADNAWRVKTWMPHANTRHMRTFAGRILKLAIRATSSFINTSGIRSQPYYGSQWFSISRELAEKIVHINNSTDYFKKFSRITCSDEHAFSMFVREHLGSEVSNDNRRYIKFPEGASSPSYLDIEEILQYNNNLDVKYWFARKFKESVMLNKLKENCNG
jgi:hypothetical protein